MPITADYHLHSNFSGDSDTPMEDMILKGIELGLTEMCFTEHMDMDFPVSEAAPPDTFTLNTDSYLYDLIKYKEKYADRIKVCFGVELGLQPHLSKELAKYAKSYDFDFIIASSHICNKTDPYLLSFYEGRSEQAAYEEYFKSVLENIKKFSNFDVYGHLDYVVRYGPNKDKNYTYQNYQDILDEILCLLIEKEKGIELNTGALKYALKEFNPCTAVLKRFKELGGEIITLGSDAHTSADITRGFSAAGDVLKACGFRYYATFSGRTANFTLI